MIRGVPQSKHSMTEGCWYNEGVIMSLA